MDMVKLNDEALNEVNGGKKVTMVCQACGRSFKVEKGTKFKGEPVCPKCKK